MAKFAQHLDSDTRVYLERLAARLGVKDPVITQKVGEGERTSYLMAGTFSVSARRRATRQTGVLLGVGREQSKRFLRALMKAPLALLLLAVLLVGCGDLGTSPDSKVRPDLACLNAIKVSDRYLAPRRDTLTYTLGMTVTANVPATAKLVYTWRWYQGYCVTLSDSVHMAETYDK